MDDTYTGWFNDTNNCYAQTGLEEDNEPPPNNTYGCDFCVPNWIEMFNECQMDDTYTTWYDDVDDCYAVTGLESDNEPPLDNTEEVVEMRVLCPSEVYRGEGVVQVSVGEYHTCILKSDGNVECRGDNRDGQAENYTEGDAVQISVGESHTCVLNSNGNVECNGGGFDYSEGNAVQVSAKGGKTCVLTERIVNRPLVYECEYMHQTQIPLVSDWNLISIPLERSNDSVESALTSIEGMYDTVFEYDSLGNSWESYYADEPEFLNSIERVNVEKGYWIKMIENASLNVSGRLLSSVNYSLYDGWNLIGYPSLVAQNITDALLDVNDTFKSVFGFEDSVWKSYSPEKPSFLNTLEIMKQGYGYWIKVENDVDWMFNGSYYER
jgi:hypothetical protein